MVAAILILAVLTTFITAINAYYIPSLAAENEIDHMQNVRNGFVELASLAASGSSNEKVQIPLGSEQMLFGPSVSSSGTLTVEEDSSWINISMEDVTEPRKEFYDETNNPPFVVNLLSVSSLYAVKLPDTSTNKYEINIDSDNWISAEWDTSSTLRVKTRRNNETVFHRSVATPLEGTDEYYAFDLLNPVYGFSEVLTNVQKPFNLNFQSGLFYVEYEKLPPYEYDERLYTSDKYLNISTGCFKYRSSNNFWIDQEFIFENGAVILQQSTSEESLVRSKPFITLDENGKLLNMHIFNVVGVEDSMSGNGITTINVQVEKYEEQIYPYVENTTVEIRSEYCEAWERYLAGIENSTISNGEMVTASFYNKSVKISTSDIKFIIP
ncbi:hypothetical protein V7O62_00885 [Methanolobus sp. ZRKC2]|uniref:hypothetical protein n=1 Tax=Methanolobus sp. ZRKC2 TaxID=3125783 RepID=UPI00324F88FD